MKEYNVGYVEYVSDGNGFNQLTFYYKYNILDDGTRSDELNKDYNAMIVNSAISDVSFTRIYDIYGNEITVLTDYIRDFLAGRITTDDLQTKIRVHYAQPEVNNGGSSSSSTNQTDQTTNICKSLQDQYITEKAEMERNTSPFSGRSDYAKTIFENEWTRTFEEAGCTKP